LGCGPRRNTYTYFDGKGRKIEKRREEKRREEKRREEKRREEKRREEERRKEGREGGSKEGREGSLPFPSKLNYLQKALFR
jgi:hypothetical protein